MKDEQKASLLREVTAYESFQAQISLEQDLYNSMLSQITKIDLSRSDLQLEYARLRGCLDILRQIKATRDLLVEQARSRKPNS